MESVYLLIHFGSLFTNWGKIVTFQMQFMECQNHVWTFLKVSQLSERGGGIYSQDVAD